jgi:hypothetical protein
MAKKFNASQFKSQMRQQLNKYNQAVNNYNRAVNNYNREVKQAINKYNQAVRQHNAKVMQNRSRIQSELRRLNSSTKITIKTTYRTSVIAVNESYNLVSSAYDYLHNPTPFQECIYTGIEQENANNIETANIIFDDTQSKMPTYSLQDTNIMNRLSNISKDLDNRWKGALFSLNPANPDATRHFCTSAREIFTEIFDSKANDTDVFAIFPACEKTDKGNATRRAKIHYFLHKKGFHDNNVEDFIEKDMQNILELFHLLSTGTHGEAGKYTFEKLSAIKQRVEDGLIFLCDIAT